MSNAVTRHFKRSPEVCAATLDDEVVLLKPGSGECYSIRGVAAVVWDAVAEPACMDDIIAVVCGRFAVTPREAASDIARFLTELRSEGLIVHAAPS